jgi:4-carboxymuconolactone decarboxylase
MEHGDIREGFSYAGMIGCTDIVRRRGQVPGARRSQGKYCRPPRHYDTQVRFAVLICPHAVRVVLRLEKSLELYKDSIMTNREAGIKVVREMMGDEAAAKLGASADSNTFGAPIAAYAVDQVFADIWTRPGLDRRSRSLVSMSVMIAMRQPHEFAIHMGAGLNNGLTLKEIEEVLIQTLPYVGYPAIATALAAAAEVIKEHGLDGDETYTGHRGLL